MLVKIYNVERENDVLTVLPVGHHVIGRGPDFKCQDKRVSRMHATIEIGKNEATFTSVHVNPCFFVSANSKTVTILKQDSSRQLESGDKFGFLPDKFWFLVEFVHGIDTVKLKDEAATLSVSEDPEDANIQLTQEVVANKRVSQSTCDQQEAKRRKCEDNGAGPSHMAENTKSDEERSKKNSCEDDQEIDAPPENIDTSQILEEGLKTDANEIMDFDSSLLEGATSVDIASNPGEIKIEPPNEDDVSCPSTSAIKEEVKNEGVDDASTSSVEKESKEKDGVVDNAAPDANPSTSNNAPSSSRRERCWYGAGCYRKNPAHRSDFSHPGDADYDSDPNDNRPICIYGANCYRKNKLHRRDYKHPSGAAPNKIRKRRAAAKKKVSDLDETPEDDYDLEDPFINDGDDSDEYQEESGSDDTDWEDSQNFEEDSEDMRRMLREAKKFTKKHK